MTKAQTLPEDRELAGKPIVFDNGYRFEMDGEGNIRIVTADGRGGDWTHYAGIAFCPDYKFFAVSAYFGLLDRDVVKSGWSGPYLKAEQLYEMREVPLDAS